MDERCKGIGVQQSIPPFDHSSGVDREDVFKVLTEEEQSEICSVTSFTPVVSNTGAAVPTVTQCGGLYARNDRAIDASMRDSLVMVRAVLTQIAAGCFQRHFPIISGKFV